MLNIDLSILNQRQTPAFYADVFANRPAAGFVGRIFISTNTFAFYRDNGTSWDLIGGPGTGTVTGTGANGQVTFWNGASTITGSNDLFWDATNGHFGVNTNAPGTALDVHHDQPTVAIFNQTVATNDVRIGFQNNGVGLWRIGAFYNAGANDFGIYDAVAAIQPVTVKNTTGQVLIGTSTVGSGKLVVASATGDNGIQIVGATAPSLRIDSAESGPTKRAGFGISTATNNFIQGSADRDFCMFNGSTTASPILFGIYDTTNVQEAARISAARNLLVGTTTDGGQKLQVNGGARATGYFLDGMTAGSGALYYSSVLNRVTLANYNVSGILTFEVNGGNQAATILSNKNFGIDTTAPAYKLEVDASNPTNGIVGQFYNTATSSQNGSFVLYTQFGIADWYIGQPAATNALAFGSGKNLSSVGSEYMRISSSGNLLIGTTTDNGQRLQVNGATYLQGLGVSPLVLTMASANPNCDIFLQSTASANPVRLRNGADNFSIFTNAVQRFTIKSDGIVNIVNTPVYATNALALAGGLVAGDIYKSATGVLSIVF